MSKMVQIGLAGSAGYDNYDNYDDYDNWAIFLFFYFSCQALENTFLGVSPHSWHWMTCLIGLIS